MGRKKNITTNNREIYEKFNMLHFSPEIVLKNAKKTYVNKILRNINKNIKILDSELIGDYILIKKVGPLNFNMYLK